MKLTYGMLLERLKTLNEEQLAMDVVVFTQYNGEVHQLIDFDVRGEEEPAALVPDPVLEIGHPYLIF